MSIFILLLSRTDVYKKEGGGNFFSENSFRIYFKGDIRYLETAHS